MDVTSNSVLTEIRAPALPDRYGNVVPGDGDVLWSGSVAAYLKRVRTSRSSAKRTVAGSDGAPQTLTKTDTLWVLASAGAPVFQVAGPDWEGTTITVEDQRSGSSVAHSFVVLAMENRVGGTAVDNVKLELATPSSNVSTG